MKIIYISNFSLNFAISGVFLGESKEVFEFISRLIAQAKRRGEFSKFF